MNDACQSRADEYIVAVENELRTVFDGYPAESGVSDAMQYSLFGGGKRVRAMLALASCEAVGSSYDDALPCAAAVELMHCYSLIHDDLPCMDNDDLRRGQPSCHVAYGEATALLAGDALQTAAFEELGTIPDPEVVKECVVILAKAAGAAGMVYGQELDTLNEGNDSVTREELDLIDTNKTCRMIEAACLMGACAGKAGKEAKKALSEYALRVGMAFQIMDDILDVVSSSDKLGKSVGADAALGKTTYASLFGVEKAQKICRELTDEAVSVINAQFGRMRGEFLSELALDLAGRSM
ncbi:MAG: polyprenyl synthetase family protein [Oscillospiraceae bacterium]|jgi:geranylgeranyl diphosphate synthase type II